MVELSADVDGKIQKAKDQLVHDKHEAHIDAEARYESEQDQYYKYLKNRYNRIDNTFTEKVTAIQEEEARKFNQLRK